MYLTTSTTRSKMTKKKQTTSMEEGECVTAFSFIYIFADFTKAIMKGGGHYDKR